MLREAKTRRAEPHLADDRATNMGELSEALCDIQKGAISITERSGRSIYDYLPRQTRQHLLTNKYSGGTFSDDRKMFGCLRGTKIN